LQTKIITSFRLDVSKMNREMNLKFGFMMCENELFLNKKTLYIEYDMYNKQKTVPIVINLTKTYNNEKN